MMQSFRKLTSHMIPVLRNDVDTDQIIPARYLKVTDKAGLADGLFYAWRYEHDGSQKEDFSLNQPVFEKAQILLAGDNFGCGSSREHAPWALMGWGIRAVISTSFADIFRNNALKNGLLPVVVDLAAHRKLSELVMADPGAELTIDLQAQSLVFPDGAQTTFPIDPFSKLCLLDGVDQLGYILNHAEQIEAYEQAQAASQGRQ